MGLFGCAAFCVVALPVHILASISICAPVHNTNTSKCCLQLCLSGLIGIENQDEFSVAHKLEHCAV